MHRLRFITCTKVPSMLMDNLSRNFGNNAVNSYSKLLLAPSFAFSSHQRRTAQTKSVSIINESMRTKISEVFYKMKDKIHYHVARKYIYRRQGYALYTHCCDRLDYLRFMREFQMPDTYYSWYLITELHVWMLMVRLAAAGVEGHHIRTSLVQALWNDAEMRKRKMGGVSGSKVNEQMQVLGYQFKAALAGYDEGLLSSDAVLAGAVWRRILQMECDDPEQVEKIVKYIRQTIYYLDLLPNEFLLSIIKVNWVDYVIDTQPKSGKS